MKRAAMRIAAAVAREEWRAMWRNPGQLRAGTRRQP